MATGLLIRVTPQGFMQGFLGSCFAFRDPRVFVTAAHCVSELEAGQLAIWVPGSGNIEFVRPGEEHEWTGIRPPLKPVAQVLCHDDADLAILRIPHDAEPTDPFWGSVGNVALGEEFHAFGYPENVLGACARPLTATPNTPTLPAR